MPSLPSNDREELQCSKEVFESEKYQTDDKLKSSYAESDADALEQVSIEDEDNEAVQIEQAVKPKASTELKRTTSNTLSRIGSHLTTHSFRDPGPPPDGGLKAWTQVAMGWLAIFTTWGWVNCFGVFQTYYTLHLDASPSSISWIGTIQNFLTFFIGAFSGRLLDAGLFLPTLLIGVTLQVVGIFMTSLCTKYWQLLLAQGILNGVGGGLFFTPCMGLMATYFSKKRSFALGVSSTGNSAGGMIYPIIVRQLLPQIGFAWTVRVIGFVNLALLSLVIAFMRPRLPPRKTGPIIDWSALKELPYTLFVVGLFFQVWDIYFTLYYVSSFGVQALGLPFAKSAILLVIINGIGIPARLIPGLIADRFGTLNTITPLAWALSIVAFSWLAVHNITGLYVFVCFYGILVAALQCLIPPTVASLTDDMSKIGARLGMMFSSMGFGALTGPPIGGAIQSAQGGRFVGSLAWAASCSFLCAVVFTCSRMSRAGWKMKAKI